MPFRSKILKDLAIIGDQFNDSNLLIDVIDIFIEQAPVQIEELSAALHRKDIETAAFHTHKLKTSAGVVGSEILQKLCLKVESLLPYSIQATAATVIMIQNEIGLECIKIQNELNDYLKNCRKASVS